MIDDAHTNLTTTTLPQGRAVRARELLSASPKLADDLLIVRPAAVLGAKGGGETAKRGPEYFRMIAAMRKTKAGRRPKKSRQSPGHGRQKTRDISLPAACAETILLTAIGPWH